MATDIESKVLEDLLFEMHRLKNEVGKIVLVNISTYEGEKLHFARLNGIRDFKSADLSFGIFKNGKFNEISRERNHPFIGSIAGIKSIRTYEGNEIYSFNVLGYKKRFYNPQNKEDKLWLDAMRKAKFGVAEFDHHCATNSKALPALELLTNMHQSLDKNHSLHSERFSDEISLYFANKLIGDGERPSLLVYTPLTMYQGLIPIRYAMRNPRIEWINHQVCSVDGKIFDPLFESPVLIKQYSVYAFGKEQNPSVIISEEDTADIVKKRNEFYLNNSHREKFLIAH